MGTPSTKISVFKYYHPVKETRDPRRNGWFQVWRVKITGEPVTSCYKEDQGDHVKRTKKPS